MPWLLNQRALYAAPNCIRHLASHRHGSTVYQTRFHTASARTGRSICLPKAAIRFVWRHATTARERLLENYFCRL